MKSSQNLFHLPPLLLLSFTELVSCRNYRMDEFLAPFNNIQVVIRARNDFLGEQIQVKPTWQAFGSWELWLRLLRKPMKSISIGGLFKFYTGLILSMVTGAHNLTFLTVHEVSNDFLTSCYRYQRSRYNTNVGAIEMGVLVNNADDPREVSIVSEAARSIEYSEANTIMSSSLSSPNLQLLYQALRDLWTSE